jgi:TPR repeat protein
MIRCLFFLLMLTGTASADDSCGRWDWCINLSEWYELGVPPLPQDEAIAQSYRREALSLAAKACPGGDLVACNVALSFNRTAKDQEIAVQVHAAKMRLCDQGYVAACNVLGGFRGMVESRERREAVRNATMTLHGAACRSGSNADCMDLAKKLIRDSRLSTSDGVLYSHVFNACLSSDDPICFFVFGELFSAGEMLKEKSGSLHQSCDEGFATSCFALANLEDHGNRDWLNKACALGHQDACGRVAERKYFDFRQGEGDLSAATDVWARGCDLGHVPSCHYLKHVSRQ